MSQLKRLAGQTVIYGASSIVGRFLNYLLVPLYTTVFLPGEYGIVTELYAYMAFLNVLFTYGFETTYFRFATKSEEPGDHFDLAQTAMFLSSLSLGAIIYFSAESIAYFLGYEDQTHVIKWVSLILAFDTIMAIPFARLRLEGKALRFASLKIANIGLNIGLNLYFLVFCPWLARTNPDSVLLVFYDATFGVGYVFLSNLIASSFYLPFFYNHFVKWKPRFDGRLWLMAVYATPLVIMGFAGVTNEMLSRALLKYLLPNGFYGSTTNLEALGIFGACYKLSVFMTLAVQAFRYASEPFFFAKSTDRRSPELFAKVMHGYIIFSSFSWLVLSLLMPDIAPIFLRNPTYLEALAIVPWLLGAGVLLGIHYNLSVWYKLTDQTKYGAWISILGAAITLGLNMILIPVIGYLGAAMTSVASYLMMVIISLILGQKNYPIPYKTGSGLFYLVFSAILICAFYFWGINQSAKYLIVIGLTSIFVLGIYLIDIRSGYFKKT